MNLIDDPFIPIEVNGKVEEVSIRQALFQAHQLGDVQASTPLETASLMRLLLPILHQACSLRSIREAEKLLQAGQFPRERLETYFERWHDRFELFGERPFLQIGNMTMDQAAPLAALATEVATGNNATLFDHTRDEQPPAYTPAEAARKLISAQAFALGFGKAGGAVVGDQPFPRPYFADAIALRGFTIWLSGRSLFETLALNLIPGHRSDPPLWERDDPLERLDRVEGGKRIVVRAQGALDRYVWQSRMVRLIPETDECGRTEVRRAFFTQGREADKTPGDPMKVFIESKTEGIYALNLNAGKASWRDLHSLLAFNERVVPRNMILSHVANLVEEEIIPPNARYGLNVVGLATDPGKAGKFLLWRHDRIAVPAALLEDENLVGRLAQMQGDAEFVASELRGRIYTVAKNFVPPHGNPDPKDVAHLADALDPRPAFWARLANHFTEMLAELPRDEEAAIQRWRAQVQQEAEMALREACRQLGHTPQALRATAKVYFRFLADAQAAQDERRERAKQAGRGRQKEEKQRERTAP